MALVVLVVLGSLSWEYHHYLEELVHQLNIELFLFSLGIVIVGSSLLLLEVMDIALIYLLVALVDYIWVVHLFWKNITDYSI